MPEAARGGHRVLVSAPYGRDAESVTGLLTDQGFDALACDGIDAVAARIDEDLGVILLTEEALAADLTPLSRALAAQPTWSNVPFVLLVGRRAGRGGSTEAVRRRLPEAATNVILFERPLSSETLVSAISSALRARQRQFEIRDRIAELDAQHLRLTALLDHLPVGVAFVNADGSTLLSNPAYRRFQPSGAVPAPQADSAERWIGHDERGNRILHDHFATERALRGEIVAGTEFRYRPPEGKEIWTRVSGIPLRNSAGEVAGSISVIVDIDEQKRALEAIADAAQKLESQVVERTAQVQDALSRLQAEAVERERVESALRQSQKMEAVGQLTGGIAHDFNNMLTGVIGGIDVVRRRIAAGRYDDLDRFMDAASVSAQRAAALTARLLAFSRRQSLDSRPTDINALLHALETLVRQSINEQIELAIVPGADVPLAIADANQLESAVLNLAINARDAMPRGGRLTIETGWADLDAAYCAVHPGIAPGRYVVVAVSDTGTGMDASTLEKAFDPFFTTKPIGLGTGLGLSMVYGFAKQSNGQVRIHSSLGNGTSVKIFLPVADALLADEAAEAGARRILQGDGQSVLLVEDDSSVRLLVRDVLEELGYEAVEAAEPNAAIDLLHSGRHFDLLITDVGLPGMNGRQLAEIARDHAPALPVLFVTGYAENAADRGEFLGERMAMISKPFQIEVLSAKICEMLSGAEPSSSLRFPGEGRGPVGTGA